MDNNALIKDLGITEDDKKRAAYALNMCMVSVSQIVDYNDINILDQEYDTILNNLNLEKIPKDEALLKILKHLLNTITFFKIQEGDKNLIEREYQHKMKNAIWSAVPNFGVLVTGDPISIAFSLANQVGIGYMNYRRKKAENDLENERQMWQLQRSAIEQFNALRRELFDTAWRLADTYNFPDDYRLTEKQIKQYNSILMDGNEIRKFERLEAIKEKFEAYPPFWYFIGNTANYIAENFKDIKISTKDKFRERALSYFAKYMELNRFNILREDQLAASCALEHVEILLNNGEKDFSKIKTLLNTAAKMSGDSFDVLQICAVNYLRIGERELAEKYLRILVNEDYNKIVNAQLLSGIYVSKRNEADYDLLKTRVYEGYLYPMPKNSQESKLLESDFEQTQKEILLKKYMKVVDENERAAREEWKKFVIFPKRGNAKLSEAVFNRGKIEYLLPLVNGNYQTKILDIMNVYINRCIELFLENEEKDKILLKDDIRKEVTTQIILAEEEGVIERINKLQNKIDNNNGDEFSFSDYESMQRINLNSIIADDFKEFLKNKLADSISNSNMERIKLLESRLFDYCIKYNVNEPEIAINGDENRNKNVVEDNDKNFISMEIFGEMAVKKQKIKEGIKNLREFAKMFCDKNSITNNDQELRVYCEDDFEEYFNKVSNSIKVFKDFAIIVLEDQRENVKIKERDDLIILPYGVISIKGGKIETKSNGINLKPTDDKSSIILKESLLPGEFMAEKYTHPAINIGNLITFSNELKNQIPNNHDLYTAFSKIWLINK